MSPVFPNCVGVRHLSPPDIEALRAASAAASADAARRISGVKTCLLFLGCPRSGHSLVGALVNAHAQAAVSHELDLLAFVERGFSWAQIAALVFENDRQFAAMDRMWEGYSYAVPGADESGAAPLLVLGDKKGVRTTRRLAADRALLARLDQTAAAPVRFIHVTRNPYDIIATRHGKSGRDLDTLIERTDGVLTAVDQLTKMAGAERVLTVRHESVIENPRPVLTEIAAFLGLVPDPAWLTAASAVIFPRPRKTRDAVLWDKDRIERVRRMIDRFPTQAGYSFG